MIRRHVPPTRRLLSVVALSAAFVLSLTTPAAAGPPVSTDVLAQDGETVYARDGAQLVRQPNGLAVSVSMPTPAPGSYLYPDGTEPGHPEVFTLWMLVFNQPQHCGDSCGLEDIANPLVEFGVYNVAGHVASGRTLTLAGRVGVGDPATAPPGITPHDLSNPAGATVHLAVTSHGALNSSTLPGEFRRPTGSGACGCWWLALFE